MDDIITEKLFELLDHIKEGNNNEAKAALASVVEYKIKLREQRILKQLEQE